MPKPAQVLGRLVAIVVAGGLLLGVCLAALVPGARQIALAHSYKATVKSLGELSQPTTVYDANGTQIGKLGVQDREPAELNEVPQILINAVIATEDRTFWKNPGIDISGVSRAFVENLTEGKISQGGSTITQQLVKNRILGNKRDLQRKAKEADPRVPPQRQVLEARDPQAVPEHGLLRAGLVRREGGGTPVLPHARPWRAIRCAGQATERADGRRGGIARRADPEPRGRQPLRAPRSRDRTPRRGAQDDGQAALHHAGAGRPGRPGSAPDREAVGRAPTRERVGRARAGSAVERPAAGRDTAGTPQQGSRGRLAGVHDGGPEPAADGGRRRRQRAQRSKAGLRRRARRHGPEDRLREGDE